MSTNECIRRVKEGLLHWPRNLTSPEVYLKGVVDMFVELVYSADDINVTQMYGIWTYMGREAKWYAMHQIEVLGEKGDNGDPRYQLTPATFYILYLYLKDFFLPEGDCYEWEVAIERRDRVTADCGGDVRRVVFNLDPTRDREPPTDSASANETDMPITYEGDSDDEQLPLYSAGDRDPPPAYSPGA